MSDGAPFPAPWGAAERWLAAGIPPRSASGPSVLGDLREDFVSLHGRRGALAAHAWYLWIALSLGTGFRVRRVASDVSDAWRGTVLDLRSSLRRLAGTPALTLTAVVSLALGASLSMASAGVANGLWLAPLPFPESSRLVEVEDTHATEVCRDCSPGTSWRAFAEWRTELDLFEAMEAREMGWVLLSRGDAGGPGARDVRRIAVTGGYFGLLGLPVAMGRGIGPADTEPGATPVAVLDHATWVADWGRDPGVLGTRVQLDGRVHQVVGVLAEDAPTLDRGAVLSSLIRPDELPGYGNRGLHVVARLAPDTDPAAAGAALDADARNRFGADAALTPGWSAQVVPLRAALLRSAASPEALVAFAALALGVLVVAALNLSALILAQVTERGHELSLRAALGASRIRVARAGTVDVVVLSALGGTLALLLAWATGGVLVERSADALPGWMTLELDLRVALLALVVIVFTAALAGAPALARALRLGARSPTDAGLSHAGKRAGRRLRLHDALLATQVVVGILVMAGSLGALRTWMVVRDFDRLGYRWEGITNLQVNGAEEGDTGGVPGLAARIWEAAGGHPAIRDHTVTQGFFLGSWGGPDAASPVRVDGAAEPVPNHRVPRHSLAVGPGYFRLREIPLVAGRAIGPDDRGTGATAAVVSRSAVGALWPGTSPAAVVGRGFSVTRGDVIHPFTVVGVSEDYVLLPERVMSDPIPRIHVALLDLPPALAGEDGGPRVTLQAALAPGAPPLPEWSRWAGEVAGGATVSGMTPVSDILRERLRPVQLAGWGMSALAGFILLLLVVGVYGTVGYRVARSRREIGVRIALGAGAPQVVWSTVRQVALLTGGALLAGVTLSILAHHLLGGTLPLGQDSPALLFLVSLLVAAAAGLAAIHPVVRALRTDPVETLRAE